MLVLCRGEHSKVYGGIHGECSTKTEDKQASSQTKSLSNGKWVNYFWPSPLVEGERDYSTQRNKGTEFHKGFIT